MQCIQLCVSSSNCEISMGLTGFKRIACEKAVGQPGFVCDYVISYSSSSRSMAEILDAIGASGAVTQGRFVQMQNGWLRVRR